MTILRSVKNEADDIAAEQGWPWTSIPLFRRPTAACPHCLGRWPAPPPLLAHHFQRHLRRRPWNSPPLRKAYPTTAEAHHAAALRASPLPKKKHRHAGPKLGPQPDPGPAGLGPAPQLLRRRLRGAAPRVPTAPEGPAFAIALPPRGPEAPGSSFDQGGRHRRAGGGGDARARPPVAMRRASVGTGHVVRHAVPVAGRDAAPAPDLRARHHAAGPCASCAAAAGGCGDDDVGVPAAASGCDAAAAAGVCGGDASARAGGAAEALHGGWGSRRVRDQMGRAASRVPEASPPHRVRVSPHSLALLTSVIQFRGWWEGCFSPAFRHQGRGSLFPG
jgi:hypothetical protein